MSSLIISDEPVEYHTSAEFGAMRSKAQPAPTGNGRIVLIDAIHEARTFVEDNDWLCTLLLDRAEQGKQKYGTWLRAHNGRNALQDALEEALDGFMYATQVNLERPSYDAEELQRLFLEAATLANTMAQRGDK